MAAQVDLWGRETKVEKVPACRERLYGLNLVCQRVQGHDGRHRQVKYYSHKEPVTIEWYVGQERN